MDTELLASLAPLLAAVAVMGVVLAVAMPKLGANKIESRLKSVKARRVELREAYSGFSKKGDMDASSIRMMRNAVSRFQMEAMLEDDTLKLKLAQAGYRSRKAAVIYVFSRLAGPPILTLLTILFFVTDPDGFEFPRHLMIAACVGGAGFFLPNLLLTNAKQKRQAEMMRAYPDMLDLMVICVESGMSVEQSFNRVAGEIANQSLALVEEVTLTTAELSFLGDRRQAYENFGARTDLSAVKAITSALIQAEQYGTPVGTALRVIAQEARDERMSKAEQKAASLPAKLTVPMMIFFLPVLFVVIMTPAAIQVMELK